MSLGHNISHTAHTALIVLGQLLMSSYLNDKTYNNECTGVQNPHRYMHVRLLTPACVYSIAHYVCLFNMISGVLNYSVHTLHLNRVLVLFSSETLHDLGVGEGTWLCHYIN